MKCLFLFLVMVSPPAFAGCENYDLYGKKVFICWDNALKAYLNSTCKVDCQAKTFIKNPQPQKLKLDRSGGKNPASQVCLKLNHKVVIMKDPRGAQQSFCEFPDGSLVDTTAIQRSVK